MDLPFFYKTKCVAYVFRLSETHTIDEQTSGMICEAHSMFNVMCKTHMITASASGGILPSGKRRQGERYVLSIDMLLENTALRQRILKENMNI